MSHWRQFFSIGLLVALLAGCASSPPPGPAVQTVAAVDLQRYLGKWYEIGRFPMFFQRSCLGDTTAEYTSLADGRIGVRNRCRTADGFTEADGRASVVPGSGNAKLKVSFFWPFAGDYWVIGLDPEYRWAVIGHPERKTLWILARTPRLSPEQLQAAKQAAQAQGYDLTGLLLTEHRE